MKERYAVTPVGSEGPLKHDGDDALRERSLRDLEDTKEYMKVLLSQESESYPPCEDYLSCIASEDQPSDVVSEAWRRKLCEWCYEVVDHFGFDREAVSIALSFLDRAVAARSEGTLTPIAKREFQLLAVTSLYTALKIHGETEDAEGPRRKLRIDAFVELSRGFFQVDVIERMESTILDSLAWRVNPPTCLKFVAAMLRLCPKWTASENQQPHATVIGGIYDVARYLSELSVCVSAFSFTCKTSVVAYASVLCAIEALQPSLQLSYDARVLFQNNMAEATGLLPNCPEVVRTRQMLKDLCPNMFEGDEIPSEFLTESQAMAYASDLTMEQETDGKSSPVCVVDNHNDSPRSKRKRSRPTDEASGRAPHRSS